MFKGRQHDYDIHVNVPLHFWGKSALAKESKNINTFTIILYTFGLPNSLVVITSLFTEIYLFSSTFSCKT